MAEYRVLSDDPATVNYGRVILEVDEFKSRLKFKIKKAWLVRKTIQSALIKTDICKVLNVYQDSIENTLAKHGPFHFYCAERFMPRGGTVQHGEAIAMMLALNVHTLQGTISKLIPAVSWKTQIKRYYDLAELYKRIKPCPDHLLDATFIGLYSVYTHLGIKPYSTMKKKDIEYIIARLVRTGRKIKIKELAAKALLRAENKRLGIVPKPKKKRKKKVSADAPIAKLLKKNRIKPSKELPIVKVAKIIKKNKVREKKK